MDYHEYINSEAWVIRRKPALDRAKGACERCGNKGRLHVHHKHYRTLGNENPDDLEALCPDCHKIADRERIARTARDNWDARLDGWASKKYGEDWESRGDADRVEEEFEQWLEGREDY